MAALTDYLADAVRDHVLFNTAYTSPTTVYLALFTTATTEAGGGTEVTGGSYARLAITFVTGATAGLATQNGALSFTAMPACTVKAAAVMDALTVGNMLIHGRLPVAVDVVGGGTFGLLDADLKVLFD